MRALLTNLACLMLAAHLVLGCCWHHEHACGTAGHSLCHDVVGDHHDDADHDHPTPAFPGSDHCQGEHCSFLVVVKVQVDNAAAASTLAAVAELPTSASIDATWLVAADGTSDHPPPIPLHLLHRVLRI